MSKALNMGRKKQMQLTDLQPDPDTVRTWSHIPSKYVFYTKIYITFSTVQYTWSAPEDM